MIEETYNDPIKDAKKPYKIQLEGRQYPELYRLEVFACIYKLLLLLSDDHKKISQCRLVLISIWKETTLIDLSQLI
jgi:hypothetical protein